jgi:hypothetical protein
MKLILCTLAICLSVLASVLTTKEVIRGEGKKIRSAMPKALAEEDGRPDPLLQKLESVNVQLGTLNRRLAALEETCARSSLPMAAPRASTRPPHEAAGLTDTLARLDALPGQLTDITGYLDQSFEHLEKTVSASAATERVDAALADLTKRLTALDGYFLPLFLFLGLDADPANNDLLATYPSVDDRLNEVCVQLYDLKKDLCYVRERLTPYVREPTKHQR